MGFVPSACHKVMQGKLLDEGGAGTVDGDYFHYWVREYLVPTLRNYKCWGPRLVVMIYNGSIHMLDEIQTIIEDAGAVLIYGAPYSPHLNPIENYFSIYKKYIKQNGERMKYDCQTVHLEALSKVDGETETNYFRAYRIPGA